jgi:glycerophosphoryl diester phosphodiesterase
MREGFALRKWAWLCVVLLPVAGLAADLPLKAPRHGGVYVVAHRGVHEGIPENTLAAYQKAIDLGCDFVEIDLRRTKDGKYISVHNSTVDDYTSDAKGPVKGFALEEIRALDVGSRVGPEWKGTPIPTFDEILDLCQGKIGIYLDFKEGDIDEVAAIIKGRGMERDVIWYIGAGPALHLKEICPECIPMPDPGIEAMLPMLIEKTKPQVVAATWKNFSKKFVDTCHAAGAIVIVDESDPGCWAEALEWGTDGIQTDHPADLIKFLNERQQK